MKNLLATAAAIALLASPARADKLPDNVTPQTLIVGEAMTLHCPNFEDTKRVMDQLVSALAARDHRDINDVSVEVAVGAVKMEATFPDTYTSHEAACNLIHSWGL